MRSGWTPAKLSAAIVGAALLLRLGFVLWAPGQLSGDALYYHAAAVALSQGAGYVELDGSPSIRWMPGWPVLVSALYRAADAQPVVAMGFNALAGAATVAFLIRLGMLWFGAACGLWAGTLYAIWPGNIYYTATLMTEPVFNALLVGCLLTFALAMRARGFALWGWIALSGFAFSSAAIVKAETWVLLPVLLAFGWKGLSREHRLRVAVLFALTASVWSVPWTLRNYAEFDRFVPTTATGGANAWLGNHPGASGGQAIIEMRAFMDRHRSETSAQTLFAASATGWREAAAFFRDHPGEAFANLGRKLVLTYSSDGHGARLLRGVGVGRVGFIPETQRRALERIADIYWGAIALAVIAGLPGLRSVSPESRIVLCGVPLCWLAVHLVFLGGPRFHVPETPVYALIASLAIVRWTGTGSEISGTEREA
jgi:hypothetical protein